MHDEACDFITAGTGIDAELYAAAAQRAVRAYCGWHVAPVLDVEGIAPTGGGRIERLPVMEVGELISLEFRGEDVLAGAEWSRSGIIEFPRPLPPSVAGLSFRAVAGYDPSEVPDVVSVAAQVARRAAQAPAGMVRSQSVNGASVTYGFSGSGAPMVSLLAEEREVLDRYRLPRLP